MFVVAGLLTYQQFSFGRVEFFDRALASLKRTSPPIEIVILDNGSSDGTEDKVLRLGGARATYSCGTPGRGKNTLTQIALAMGADLIVLSDDDMEWKDGWLEYLLRALTVLPPHTKLVGGVFEDEYPWNQISGSIEFCGIQGLFRASTSGNSWIFRAEDAGMMGMDEKTVGVSDVPVCNRLIRSGFTICQLDLATNLGLGKSTWGNKAEAIGSPLDRERWFRN